MLHWVLAIRPQSDTALMCPQHVQIVTKFQTRSTILCFHGFCQTSSILISSVSFFLSGCSQIVVGKLCYSVLVSSVIRTCCSCFVCSIGVLCVGICFFFLVCVAGLSSIISGWPSPNKVTDIVG